MADKPPIPPVGQMNTTVGMEAVAFGFNVLVQLRYPPGVQSPSQRYAILLAWLALSDALRDAGYDLEDLVRSMPKPIAEGDDG